jgi:hypothetical protein
MKRKRSSKEQAVVDAAATKRAAIAAEVALGPIPTRLLLFGMLGPFAPWRMREGLFDSDEPGELWAAHPDFAPSEVLVSNYGRVATRGKAGVGEYEVCSIGTLTKQGYRSVGIDGKHKLVHILVCEAFHGPKPNIKGITVDHIAKYGGDFVRERSDNRACNLRWATLEEQRENQKEHSATSIGVPVLARKVGSTDDWVSYASAFAAGKALGIGSGNISKVCNVKKSSITAGGYMFKIDTSSLEVQGDLPREELGPAHARFCVSTERWKVDPMSHGRTRVSTRGRVQTKTPTGDAWGPRRTPLVIVGTNYAKVGGTGVHQVVWRTFCPNDPPINNETIDHLDQDPSNNALHNLRRATKSQQMRNQTRPLADDIVRFRTPMLAWKENASIETAVRFVGGAPAARALNEQLDTTKFTPGNISRAARNEATHNGWRFKVDETAEAVAARAAQRQRVCAAIAALRAAAVCTEQS